MRQKIELYPAVEGFLFVKVTVLEVDTASK